MKPTCDKTLHRGRSGRGLPFAYVTCSTCEQYDGVYFDEALAGAVAREVCLVAVRGADGGHEWRTVPGWARAGTTESVVLDAE